MFSKSQAESVAKHLRALADIFDNTVKASAEKKIVVEESTVAKRGRKPGAVSDDVRCTHINGNTQRCKNRATKGKVCGKHDKN
jgi:hypothetical protein